MFAFSAIACFNLTSDAVLWTINAFLVVEVFLWKTLFAGDVLTLVLVTAIAVFYITFFALIGFIIKVISFDAPERGLKVVSCAV